MSAAFRFPVDAPQNSFWTTLAVDNNGTPKAQTANRGDHEMSVIGRLKPGVTVVQANADMSAIASRLAKQYPDTNAHHNSATRGERAQGEAGRYALTSAGHSGSGGTGAAHRVRERGKPAAGAGTRARAGVGDALRSRCKPSAAGAATTGGKHNDWRAWRRDRMRSGICVDAGRAALDR